MKLMFLWVALEEFDITCGVGRVCVCVCVCIQKDNTCASQ